MLYCSIRADLIVGTEILQLTTPPPPHPPKFHRTSSISCTDIYIILLFTVVLILSVVHISSGIHISILGGVVESRRSKVNSASKVTFLQCITIIIIILRVIIVIITFLMFDKIIIIKDMLIKDHNNDK
jgi:hypothetical protein